jgi:hypothetical protein
MNEQPKFKHIRGHSNAEANRRTQIVTRAKRAASRRQPAEMNVPLAAPAFPMHPARGLLICIGWLRLFRTIVSGDLPSARRPVPHEI